MDNETNILKVRQREIGISMSRQYHLHAVSPSGRLLESVVFTVVEKNRMQKTVLVDILNGTIW